MTVHILTLKEYSRKYKINGKYVSAETIKRMCENDLMPTWTFPRFIQGTCIWVIAVLIDE